MVSSAKSTDPLKVQWSVSTLAALSFFLFRFGPQAIIAPLYKFNPIINLIIDRLFLFDNLLKSPPTFGQYAAAQKLPHALPKALQSNRTFKVMDGVHKMALLESTTPLGAPGLLGGLGNLGYSMMNAITGVFSTISNSRSAWKHRHTRPLQGIYKLASEALVPAKYLLNLVSFGNAWWNSNQQDQEKAANAELCAKYDPKADVEGYKTAKEKTQENPLEKNAVIQEEAVAVVNKLDPTCPKQARIILSREWDEDAFQKNGRSYVNKLFRNSSLILHPDKNTLPNAETTFDKLERAKETLIKELNGDQTDENPAADSYPPWIKTATKIGLTGMAMNLPFFAGLNQYLLWGSIAYSAVSNIYSLASFGYSKIRDYATPGWSDGDLYTQAAES